MVTWYELYDEEEVDKSKEKANLASVASTFSDLESEDGSDSNSEDVKEVFSKLSISDLITLSQDLMDRCQQKAKHMKIIRKQYDLIRDTLNFLKTRLKNLKEIKFL